MDIRTVDDVRKYLCSISGVSYDVPDYKRILKQCINLCVNWIHDNPEYDEVSWKCIEHANYLLLKIAHERCEMIDITEMDKHYAREFTKSGFFVNADKLVEVYIGFQEGKLIESDDIITVNVGILTDVGVIALGMSPTNGYCIGDVVNSRITWSYDFETTRLMSQFTEALISGGELV
ncbi:hypothetical protein [Komagataeibacter nataicola]|nr:hypothetical protein [Komagataeibacter nataicola]GBR23448.1 hypothetical protein AA0616_2525 [Komagataeibacter nataicola NRIC 0616]